MAANTASKVTTDHEEIVRWAVARDGRPAGAVRSKNGDDDGVLIRISFPADREASALNEISWKDWFKKFEAGKLALLFQEHIAGGEKSNFHKLVERESVDEVEAAVGGKGRSASRRRNRRAEVRTVIPAAPAEPPRSNASEQPALRAVSPTYRKKSRSNERSKAKSVPARSRN
jgi:hypothetical protein